MLSSGSLIPLGLVSILSTLSFCILLPSTDSPPLPQVGAGPGFSDCRRAIGRLPADAPGMTLPTRFFHDLFGPDPYALPKEEGYGQCDALIDLQRADSEEASWAEIKTTLQNMNSIIYDRRLVTHDPELTTTARVGARRNIVLFLNYVRGPDLLGTVANTTSHVILNGNRAAQLERAAGAA